MITRVFLVDDHAVVRRGIRMFLSTDPEIEVVGEAGNGREALELIEQCRPQVVLMDLMMPGLSGTELIGECRARFPEVEVIALTSVLEDRLVVNAVKAGASGYLLKTTQPEELQRAIKAAGQGRIQLSPEASQRLVNSLLKPDPLEALSERELEVLKLLASGASNKEMSETLCLAEKTVKAHVSHILSKLNLTTRTQAAVYAWQTGLVRPTL